MRVTKLDTRLLGMRGGLAIIWIGFVIAYPGVPAFILTLVGLLAWGGAAWRVTSGRTVAPMDATVRLMAVLSAIASANSTARLDAATNAQGTLDDVAMEAAAREVMARLNCNFERFKEPVASLSGGQRQSVAIARAIHFNARILLIRDEPTGALGPQETQQVADLIKQLEAEGIGIFLISHDICDVFDLADRVDFMKNGRMVGQARTSDMTKDEVLGMIILGKCPPGAVPGPGALEYAA